MFLYKLDFSQSLLPFDELISHGLADDCLVNSIVDFDRVFETGGLWVDVRGAPGDEFSKIVFLLRVDHLVAVRCPAACLAAVLEVAVEPIEIREGPAQHVSGCPHRRTLGNPRAELPHEIADEPLGVKRPQANVE